MSPLIDVILHNKLIALRVFFAIIHYNIKYFYEKIFKYLIKTYTSYLNVIINERQKVIYLNTFNATSYS